MSPVTLGLLVALATCLLAPTPTAADYYDEFYQKLAELEIAANMTNPAKAQQNMQPTGAKIDCGSGPSPTVPESVHALRPGDIKVVTGVGDSITAGFGALSSSIITIATEYRGISWSMGGDASADSVATVPNFLKTFNPGVKGWSIKTGKETSENAKLNKAVSGAIARDVPAQMQQVIAKMKSDPEIDYENDWKVLTLWVGGNDLCAVCKGNEENQPAYYADYVRQSLDYLHQVVQVPRMYINLVQILDVSRLNEVTGIICSIVHFVACSCGTTGGAADREKVRLAALEYQVLFEELVNSGRYDSRDDFTVVLQPFFINTQVPKKSNGAADTSFFAPDCFHFSGKGHAASAIALWNNMLEPVGQKSTEWNIGAEPRCPSEEYPYFFTSKNSPSRLNSGGLFLESDVPAGPNAGGKKSNTLLISTLVAVGIVMAVAVVVVAVYRRGRKVLAAERQPLVKASNV